MNIKNFFIYNIQKEDCVQINQIVVKAKNANIPVQPKELEGIRVVFSEDWERAVAEGCEERLDSFFVNAAQFKREQAEDGCEHSIKMLGIPRTFKISVK